MYSGSRCASDSRRSSSPPLSLSIEAVMRGCASLRVPFPPVEYSTPGNSLATTLRRARLVPRGALLVLPAAARGVVRQSSGAASPPCGPCNAAAGPRRQWVRDDDGMQQAMQQMLQQMAQMEEEEAGDDADDIVLVARSAAAAGMIPGAGAMDYEALMQMGEALGDAVNGLHACRATITLSMLYS